MTKIEEVARAICSAELPTDAKWELCVPAALAAIKAMLVPTEVMVAAMEADGGHSVYRWEVGINAALNERIDD